LTGCAAVSTTGSSPSPTLAHEWKAAVWTAGAHPLFATISDRSGSITAVEVVPQQQAAPLSQQDSEMVGRRQIIVRARTDAQPGFLVDWPFGACRDAQTFVVDVARAPATLRVTLDRGPDFTALCDLMLLGAELRITTANAVDPSTIEAHATR
jgi:hypothetical protein